MATDRLMSAAARESELVNSWDYDLRWFWSQLWGYCDDWGRGKRDPRLVEAGTMPLDDRATVAVVDRWMRQLESAGVIHVYTVGSKEFFECVNWDEHQPLKYRRKTEIPDRFGVIPKPGKVSETFSKDSPEREGEREEERERESAQSAPPSPFCGKHPGGTDDPCRACGNARRRRDAWDAEQKAKPRGPATLTYLKSKCAIEGHLLKASDRYCDRCGERVEGSPELRAVLEEQGVGA